MSSAKWRPYCLGLNVLKIEHQINSDERNASDVYINVQIIGYNDPGCSLQLS